MNSINLKQIAQMAAAEQVGFEPCKDRWNSVPVERMWTTVRLALEGLEGAGLRGGGSFALITGDHRIAVMVATSDPRSDDGRAMVQTAVFYRRDNAVVVKYPDGRLDFATTEDAVPGLLTDFALWLGHTYKVI
jgi:hypothetical protein